MKLKEKMLWVDWHDIAWGIMELICYAREVDAPVGVAWCDVNGIRYRSEKTHGVQIQVHNIWVPEAFRRNGVAWAIHRAMFNELKADIVKTQNGSKTGGLKQMLALGFEIDTKAGVWVLTKKEFRQRDKARLARKNQEHDE